MKNSDKPNQYGNHFKARLLQCLFGVGDRFVVSEANVSSTDTSRKLLLA